MGKKPEPGPQELPDAPYPHRIEVATLSRAIETTFDLRPDGELQQGIAAFLGIETLDALRFKGALHPRRKDEWRLDARLTAVAEQACIVSLVPVPEKIDARVRLDLIPEAKAASPDEAEVELEEGEEPEYFQDEIDLGAIAVEQLALALDPYPRALDAELETATYSEPGVAPLQDADLKPFAKLAALKARLAETDGDSGDGGGESGAG